jgi:hypothetical protein
MVSKKLNRLECFDGFSVSLQGSEGNYSSPRKDNATYGAIEAGYPSVEEELLEPYQEDKQMPMQESVFGWVPMKVIYDIVIKHGGWQEGGIPPMIGLTQEDVSSKSPSLYSFLAASPYKEATWKHQMRGHRKGATNKERRSVPGVPLPGILEYLQMAYTEDKDEMKLHWRDMDFEDEHPFERVLYKGLPVPPTWWARRRQGPPHYLESLLNYHYLSPPLYPNHFLNHMQYRKF